MNQPGIDVYIGLIDKCLSDLGHPPAAPQLEKWALLIYRAMGGRSRIFHSQHHPIELMEDSDPISSLACLLHDVVYVQVDRGLPPHLSESLNRFVVLDNGTYRVAPPAEGADASWGLAAEVFGLKAGDALSPFSGLNEYLSGIVAATEFGGALTPPELAQVLCCIEATIPFRGVDADGKSPFDRLAVRLAALNEKYRWGLKSAGVVAAVQRAALVAGRDVGNFSGDPALFLDNTWMLLPETNPTLSDPNLYTIKEYRSALQKMEGFLGQLKAERVFYRYEGVPDEKSYAARTQAAARNIALSTRYLRAKLMAAGILEALSEISGGDAPISLFMGQIPAANPKSRRLESFLPAMPATGDADPLLRRLLEDGRASEMSFDMKRAPLAAFIYRHLGEAGLERAHQDIKLYFAGKSDSKQLLRSFDRGLIDAVSKAVAQMVSTRRDSLNAQLAAI